MKVLILGGAGFIGPRVTRLLLGRGHQVAVMDVNPSSVALAPYRDRIELSRGDITLMDDVVEAVETSKPDRVLNLAYLTSEGDPHFGVRLNVLGMDNCFEAARLCGVKRVIYASSVAAYGPQRLFGSRAVTEDDLPMASGIYGVSKVYNEHQAQWYSKAFDMEITGLRPAFVTGPDKVNGSMDHVRCITLPAQGEPISFRFRDASRVLIHVEDIAEAFVRVTLAESPKYPVYNSGGETISMGAIADIVKGYLPDAQISFENDAGGLDMSPLHLMDNTRLRQEFEISYAPFRQRVLEIINDIRAEAGLPAVSG